MGVLGPVASAVAGQVGIPPQVATSVAGIAMHYLLSSHPAARGSAPLNLPSVMQQMASRALSAETLRNSGMVNAVMKSTGLSQQDAQTSLDATFNHLASHVNKERLAGKLKAKRDSQAPKRHRSSKPVLQTPRQEDTAFRRCLVLPSQCVSESGSCGLPVDCSSWAKNFSTLRRFRPRSMNISW